MSVLVEQVRAALNADKIGKKLDIEDALVEAERLADLFSEVKPVPYIVPIERFAGMSVFNREKSLI